MVWDVSTDALFTRGGGRLNITWPLWIVSSFLLTQDNLVGREPFESTALRTAHIVLHLKILSYTPHDLMIPQLISLALQVAPLTHTLAAKSSALMFI